MTSDPRYSEASPWREDEGNSLQTGQRVIGRSEGRGVISPSNIKFYIIQIVSYGATVRSCITHLI